MRPRYRGNVQQTSRGLFGATEIHHPAGRSVWRTAKTTNVALLIAALTGPLFYRRWFSREPLTSAFAKQIVRLVLRQD